MDEIRSVGASCPAPTRQLTEGLAPTPNPFTTNAQTAWSGATDKVELLDSKPSNGSDSGSSSVEWVNGQAGKMLDGFAWVGRQYEYIRAQANGSHGETIKTLGALDGIQRHLNRNEIKALTSRTGNIGKDPQAMLDYMEKIHNGRFSPGSATKVLGLAGGVLDSVTGVLSAAKEFHRERSAGSTRYPGTMKNILKTVAQVSGGYAAGTLVAGATASLAGAPVVVVVGSGIAAAYSVGKLLDWIVA